MCILTRHLLRDDGDRVERGELRRATASDVASNLEREEPHFRASPRVARDAQHGSARRMSDARVGRALGDGRRPIDLPAW